MKKKKRKEKWITYSFVLSVDVRRISYFVRHKISSLFSYFILINRFGALKLFTEANGYWINIYKVYRANYWAITPLAEGHLTVHKNIIGIMKQNSKLTAKGDLLCNSSMQSQLN